MKEKPATKRVNYNVVLEWMWVIRYIKRKRKENKTKQKSPSQNADRASIQALIRTLFGYCVSEMWKQGDLIFSTPWQ